MVEEMRFVDEFIKWTDTSSWQFGCGSRHSAVIATNLSGKSPWIWNCGTWDVRVQKELQAMLLQISSFLPEVWLISIWRSRNKSKMPFEESTLGTALENMLVNYSCRRGYVLRNWSFVFKIKVDFYFGRYSCCKFYLGRSTKVCDISWEREPSLLTLHASLVCFLSNMLVLCFGILNSFKDVIFT